MDVLAHGIGSQSDLPLDPTSAVVGGGVAVLVSFLALTGIWRAPRLRPDSGRPLPGRVAAFLDAPAVRTPARAVVLVAALLVVAVALLGPDDIHRNPGPWAFFATFWVGIVPASVLLGPVWRVVNPLRTLHRGFARLVRAPRRPLPAGVGLWPAAVVLAGVGWLELVAPGRSDPRLVGAVLLAYAVVQLAVAAVVGDEWFSRGDGFEVYSELLARMAPIGRRTDGVLVLRTPLAGTSAPAPPGTAAVACVLIGTTGFDGLGRTVAWQQLAGGSGADGHGADGHGAGGIIVGTLGLAGCIAVVALLFAGALFATPPLAGSPRSGLPARFATTLLPIALGYAVAHYFSLFVLEGGAAFRLAAELLGVAGPGGPPGTLPPALVAAVQINAIVLGHVAATIAAHDVALRSGLDRRAEVPLLVVMIALTCAALAVLLG